jgi:hypothetical protein
VATQRLFSILLLFLITFSNFIEADTATVGSTAIIAILDKIVFPYLRFTWIYSNIKGLPGKTPTHEIAC